MDAFKLGELVVLLAIKTTDLLPDCLQLPIHLTPSAP